MRRLLIWVLVIAILIGWAYYERRPITRHLDNLAAWVKKQAR